MNTKHSELWIVKGIVTDPSAYADSLQITKGRVPVVGDVEWRVFDTDPSAPQPPSFSADFLRLEDALAYCDGSIVHMVEDAPSDVTLYDRWQSLRETYSPVNMLELVRDSAYQQGILGTLLDGMEQSQ